MEIIGNLERTPRSYIKRKDNYWKGLIKDDRKKRHRLSTEQVEEDEKVDIETLTPKEIRAKLKELGVITKWRNLKKLKELYIKSSANKENERPGGNTAILQWTV